MAFRPTPLQIFPSRTDYSAETRAFEQLGQTLGNLIPDMRKQQLEEQKRQGLARAGEAFKKGDYATAAGEAAALGDFSSAVGLGGMLQKQKQNDLVTSTLRSWGTDGGGIGLGSTVPQASLGTPNGVESSFMGGIQKAGLTNPVGLGAVAAYGKSESGWSPENVNKTWSDPSESGAAGTSGGTMSWRADRLQNLQRFAAGRGEQGNGSPETQAAFLAQEDPTLIPRLNAAKTPQEANQIMANAWRFAGYDRPGQGEYARREALTTQYAQRYGSQAAGTPAQPVQVAEAGPGVSQPSGATPGAADNRAPGSQEAGFYIPGTNTTVSSVPSIANDSNVKLWQQRLNSQAAVQNDGVRAIAQRNLDIAIKDAERRYNDGKAPESVREWQWARQNGMTKTNSPVEYAKELAAAKRDPDSDVTNLRKEVQQLPSYKNLAQAAPIYRSMFDTAGRNTKASDLNLVYGLGKIMDPTSVVREGEMIMVKNSAGMSEQLMGAINALNGGAALTPETRQALMQEAYSRMDTYRQQFDQDMGQYRGIVGRRGFNADDVIPNIGEFKPYEAPPKPSGKGQPAPTAQAQRLPQDYVDQYRRPDGSSPPLPSQTTPARPADPRRGELQEGYRFKGGDAGDPKNWVKVK
ncbi:hypothetical protein [Bosea beijingensis]